MDAEIVGVSGDLLGIRVVDNETHEHEVSIDMGTGTVAFHDFEAYPADVDARTVEESERISQAQRFAKYRFAREMNGQMRPVRRSPDRIETAREVLGTLSGDRFEDHFGTYRAQVASHLVDERERPHPLPREGVEPAAVRYEQSIALGEETVAAVSGVEAVVSRPFGGHRRNRHGPPIADEDVRLELRPADLDPQRVASTQAFRHAVDHHLTCQIRDCHLRMGRRPPAFARVRGPGFPEATRRYEVCDCYEPYHDADVAVDGWQPD